MHSTVIGSRACWRDRGFMDAARQSRLESAPEKRLKARGRSSLLERAVACSLRGAPVLGVSDPAAGLRGPILPGTLTGEGEPQHLRRQHRRDHDRFLDPAVDRNLPGIRRSLVISSRCVDRARHCCCLFSADALPLRSRRPLAGFLLHVSWLYLLYFYAERRIRRRIAIVPFGGVDAHRRDRRRRLGALKRARAARCTRCDAIVADFTATCPTSGRRSCRRGTCRAYRLPGQATVGIAHRPGRAGASVGEQLRVAASRRAAIST